MDKKHISALLDTLIGLDQQTTRAYYEMGQLLHSFNTGRLFEVLGYESFKHMVEEELTFSVATAQHYTRLYAESKRLKYTKPETLKLLREHGFTQLSRVLPSLKQKLGTRAIKTRIDALDMHQINFTLTTAELTEVHAALAALGATQTDNGRYLRSTEAFMEMVRSTKWIKSQRAA